MRYKVFIVKKALKGLEQLPIAIQCKLKVLIRDLEETGPIQHAWPNYSKLSEETYHCHLAHKWVACWRMSEKNIRIEVYYAGSRENAPY